jgi:hypothetical protein
LKYWGYTLPGQVKYLWQIDGPIPPSLTVSTAIS